MKNVLALLERGEFNRENMDWYRFLGFCDFHRLSGYVAGKLPEDIPPQVKRHLNIQNKYQAIRQRFLSDAATELEGVLRTENLPHAFLKGSALCGTLYQPGERGSNDIDLLIPPKSVGAVGKILESLGYAQGMYQNDSIHKFSRQEIISRRMNRGETAPYLKLTGDEMVPFVEVDLNFSLDWLPASNVSAVEIFLENTLICEKGLEVLTPEYSLLFLCTHLYKEATVLSMVKRFKDIELYKYYDIFKLIPFVDRAQFFGIAKALGLEKECDYALYHTQKLFPSCCFEVETPSNRDEVLDPEENNKRYQWDLDFLSRLEDTDRQRFLYEDSLAIGDWKELIKIRMGRTR